MSQNPFDPTPDTEPTDGALEDFAPPASSAAPQPTPPTDLDTSEKSFASAFDNIAAIVPRADQAIKDLPATSMDEVEVQVESTDGNVSVTIRKAAIESLDISPAWLDGVNPEALTTKVKATVNEALAQYNATVMTQLTEATPELKEVNRAVNAVRAQIRGAFDKEMARIANGGVTP